MFSVFLASEFGHIEVVKELIENGANINSKNYYKFTPLIQG
jgi:ankyrin repeat protein